MSKIKTFTAIAFCKTLRSMAGLLGRGSSLPGALTLKLFPGILGQIEMPENIIAVTGSNGKTSTVELIADALEELGMKVSCNREGSNQIEGVTTFVLADSDMSGKLKSDVVVIESDERFARHTFKYIKPKYYVITNLYRDQLTRNGHPEWIFDIISDSIDENTHLILNADDPLVSKFGYHREGVTYFGADRLATDTEVNYSAYNDGKYCPVCKAPLKYEYYHYNHIGKYACTSCDFRRMDANFNITEANLEQGYITINNTYRINLNFSSIYHCYNAAAAFAAVVMAGGDPEKAAEVIGKHSMKSGRVTEFNLGDKQGTLLVSKHENSISYDRSVDIAAGRGGKTAVMVIVDAVSRKYFTGETSWLWDIDFEKLNSDGVSEVVLAGRYCNDLANRFLYTGIPEDKIKVFESIPQAADYLKGSDCEYIYTITCLSDMDKFLALTDGKGVSV